MYEIWLVVNILWEIALGILPMLLALLVLWAGLLAVAWRQRGAWRRALPRTAASGAMVSVLAFVLLPGLTQSSLSEMGYWVDWANLAAMALGFGGVASALTWPLFAWSMAPGAGAVSPKTPDGKSDLSVPGAAA